MHGGHEDWGHSYKQLHTLSGGKKNLPVKENFQSIFINENISPGPLTHRAADKKVDLIY